MMNLFEKALQNQELDKFILGIGEYLVVDRDYGNHWPLGSYNNYIRKYLFAHGDFFDNTFWSEICNILDRHADVNIFLDYLVGYLIAYYYPENSDLIKIRTQNTPDFFTDKIGSIIDSRRNSLLADRRGTGTGWHSKDGLYGSVTGNLKIINQRGGPNFLADF